MCFLLCVGRVRSRYLTPRRKITAQQKWPASLRVLWVKLAKRLSRFSAEQTAQAGPHLLGHIRLCWHLTMRSQFVDYLRQQDRQLAGGIGGVTAKLSGNVLQAGNPTRLASALPTPAGFALSSPMKRPARPSHLATVSAPDRISHPIRVL